MAGAEPESLSPSGIRDGDPAVLAALCTERAPAVLAYAEAVCPPPVALRAAAEAFARFRAALHVLGDMPGLDLDALLLGATRRASAELCPPPAAGLLGRRRACAEVPALIAARLEGELTAADGQRLAVHLARDPRCRAIEERFAEAERAFAAAPAAAPSAEVAAAIVGALAAAAPRAGDVGPAPAGGTASPPAPAEREASEPVPSEADPGGSVPPEAEAGVPVPPEAEAGGSVPPEALPAAPEASTAPTAVHATAPAAAPPPPAAGGPPAADDAGPGRPPAFARARRHRPVNDEHHGALRTVVLPLAVVGAAAVAAMAIAGVFGEDQPLVPPAQPPLTAPVETIPPRAATPPRTPAPDRVDEDVEPPPVVRGNGEGEDALGGLGVPAPGVAATPAG